MDALTKAYLKALRELDDPDLPCFMCGTMCAPDDSFDDGKSLCDKCDMAFLSEQCAPLNSKEYKEAHSYLNKLRSK